MLNKKAKGMREVQCDKKARGKTEKKNMETANS